MSDNRVATVVKEIEYWKEHKILPEQQCDFLLALYKQGNEVSNAENIQESNSKVEKNKLVHLILLFLLIPVAFLVLYFSDTTFYFQTAVLLLFLSYSLWMFFNFKQHKNIIFHASLVVSLLLCLLLSILVVTMLFESTMIMSLVIISNFVIWFILGREYKLMYIIITSILGLVFLSLYLFNLIYYISL